MLYNNICMKAPTTLRPATASLTPIVPAELFLVLVELDEEPVAVLVPMLVGLATLPLQLFFPSIALSSVIELQLEVISAVLSMLEPPETTVRPLRETDEKFPVKSMAPPTVVSVSKAIPSKAVLLAIWKAPPTVFRPGMVMLVRLGFATKAKLPVLPPVFPTLVKFGALTDVK